MNNGVRPVIDSDLVAVEDLPQVASALEKAIVAAGRRTVLISLIRLGIEIVELLDKYWLAIRSGNVDEAKEIWNKICKLADEHLNRAEKFISASDPALTKNLRLAVDKLRPLLKELEAIGLL
jgi:hypothetical protein